MSSAQADPARADPGAILTDLPESVWPGLLALIRKTMDTLEPEQVPRRLRPFIGWRPERFDCGVVRAAVVAAVPGDARFRAALRKMLEDAEPALSAAAENSDGERLRVRHDVGTAAAALVAVDRWDALAILAAEQAAADARTDVVRESSGRHASQADEPAPANLPRSPGSTGADANELADELRRSRERVHGLEQDVARAKERAAQLAAELAQVQDRLAAADSERDAAARALADAQSRHRSRLARLRRQVGEARARAEDRDRRIRTLTDQLSGVLRDLTEPTDATRPPIDDVRSQPRPPARERPDASGSAGSGAAGATIPRRIKAARPGRPARLPPGVVPESVAAVESMLQIDDLELMLDGYNVTKDLRGRPTAPLPEQRLWLVRTVAGVTAMYTVRPTIVFDGDAGTAGRRPSARGVRVVFTEAGEAADDRIKDYVRAMDIDVPILVITSDREIRDEVREVGADVVASGVFLKAIGASS